MSNHPAKRRHPRPMHSVRRAAQQARGKGRDPAPGDTGTRTSAVKRSSVTWQGRVVGTCVLVPDPTQPYGHRVEDARLTDTEVIELTQNGERLDLTVEGLNDGAPSSPPPAPPAEVVKRDEAGEVVAKLPTRQTSRPVPCPPAQAYGPIRGLAAGLIALDETAPDEWPAEKYPEVGAVPPGTPVTYGQGGPIVGEVVGTDEDGLTTMSIDADAAGLRSSHPDEHELFAAAGIDFLEDDDGAPLPADVQTVYRQALLDGDSTLEAAGRAWAYLDTVPEYRAIADTEGGRPRAQ